MHARNRTWLLGSDPVERCRQRTLPVEGGDGSTLSLDFTTGVLDPRLTFTRSTTGTFTNASGLVASAAINTPRFDYDPTTRQPRGLLIEGSATNLAFWSENINPNAAPQNVYWTVSGTGASVTPTSQTDPANGTSASRCILGTSAVGRVYQGITTTAGITYTLSFWAKSVSGTTSLAIWHFNSATGNSTALTVGTSWTRYQVTILGRTGGGFVECGIANLTSNAATVDLWGLQLETGSGASSYIPTGASTGSRAVDVCTMSNITALNYNANGGTLFAHFSNNTENANFAGSIGFNNGANYAQRLRWGSGSLTGSYFQTNGTTTLGSNLGGSRTSFASAKAATSYSFDGTTTSTAMSINGAQATTTPTSSAVSGVSIATAFALNSDNSSAATAYPSLAVRSVKFYPTALTMAQMNAITANP
jgi:hypothetical protein